jgi:hypothetical protein
VKPKSASAIKSPYSSGHDKESTIKQAKRRLEKSAGSSQVRQSAKSRARSFGSSTMRANADARSRQSAFGAKVHNKTSVSLMRASMVSSLKTRTARPQSKGAHLRTNSLRSHSSLTGQRPIKLSVYSRQRILQGTTTLQTPRQSGTLESLGVSKIVDTMPTSAAGDENLVFLIQPNSGQEQVSDDYLMLRQAVVEGTDLDYFTSKNPNVSSFQFDEVVDHNLSAEQSNLVHQKLF